MVDDISLMNEAAKEAWKYQGLTYPNPAVGALISDDFGSILSCKAHTKAGNPHAEVEVIKDAFIKLTNDEKLKEIENSDQIHDYLVKNHNGIFEKYSLHVTLEPCNHYGKTPPCSHLIKELRFKRVVVGLRDTNKIASGGAEFLRQNGIEVDVLENCQKCEDLLLPFKKWQDKNFVFFKLAMSLNGVIDGGIITSKSSRKLVHKFRDKCDLLVIGGNTVRVDRPTLDARLCSGKAPDILIYSKRKVFDKSMPLFGVKNRKVFAVDNFDILKTYKNIMIEGGAGMLKATKDIVDLYTIFRSSNFKIGNHPDIELKLQNISHIQIENDSLGWYKSYM
jgi:diaminohydroxyphosphoribosylaminopyrimidine deaminase/5-amino-6-(5-phosphoribosylamino)uracil reductase